MTARDISIQLSFRVTLRHISLLLVAVGIGVSGYLSYFYLTDTLVPCAAGEAFQCDVVQNSIYAEMFGIPIALLGLASYLVMGGLLLLEDRLRFLQESGLVILFGVVMFAFLYSLYLIYIQAVILDAWCQWCLMHEITISALMVVTTIRLRNSLLG